MIGAETVGLQVDKCVHPRLLFLFVNRIGLSPNPKGELYCKAQNRPWPGPSRFGLSTTFASSFWAKREKRKMLKM